MTSVRLRMQHGTSRLLHYYADLRIGATEVEKHCHKTSDSVLLTFDDYGSEQEIEDILTILAHKRVRAMVFPTGEWANEHPDLVRRIQKAGHILGNHTFSHRNLLTLATSEVESEIRKGLHGRWLRAPEGRSNKRIRTVANRLGYSLCYWTIDSRDWTGASVDTMRHTILSELQPGSVILFHLHGTHTRELLPSLIDDIRSRGFTLTDQRESW